MFFSSEFHVFRSSGYLRPILEPMLQILEDARICGPSPGELTGLQRREDRGISFIGEKMWLMVIFMGKYGKMTGKWWEIWDFHGENDRYPLVNAYFFAMENHHFFKGKSTSMVNFQ